MDCMRAALYGFVLVLALGVLAPSPARCDITGGGWIPDAKGDGGKATFGFDLFGTESTGRGTFSYHDRTYTSSAFPNGVNVNGTAFYVVSYYPGLGYAQGTYTAQQGGTSGDWQAFFGNTGQGGAFKQDILDIFLSPFGPTSPEYINVGYLGNGGPGGGNLTMAGASTVSLGVFLLLVLGWAGLRLGLRRRGYAR
jgi:hypothetical protein